MKCPYCHKEIKLTCNRCNYNWTPKEDAIPKTCANKKCKSPYWNKKRINTIKLQKEKIFY